VLSLFPGVTHCRNERLLHVKNGSATPIRAEPNSTADQWAIFAVLLGFVEEKAEGRNRFLVFEIKREKNCGAIYLIAPFRPTARRD
jgi:hypothetical protein